VLQGGHGRARRVLDRPADHVAQGEAPAVAEYYISHNNAYYVRTGHAVDALLRDAEKLRTEWATNRRITETRARQIDRKQTTADAFQPLIDEAEARNGK